MTTTDNADSRESSVPNAPKPVGTRKCSLCGGSGDKRGMLRVAKTKDGVVFLDKAKNGKGGGRGAYLCAECSAATAEKKHALERVLKCKVPPEVYAEMKAVRSEQ
ncbi:MAG: YlxR family protein [Oscillospiraceae bacterium]|jgi:predicted RNA-binding protein YlxR (DUF448 family)|nr:YlxR family protein [Oscillospiraceae bacterium]